MLYDSLIFPQLTYANIIWGNTYKTTLRPLFIAQKRVIRTIMYRNRLHHTNEDFKALKILKLGDINLYFGSNFVYKSLNSLTFPVNYFSYSQNTNYNLRNLNDLQPRFAGSTQGQSSPGFYCPLMYNELPAYIKNKPSISSFKLALRCYLLNKY